MDMTFTVTVTLAVILAVKLMFKNKFGPKWHVLIWLVLLVRLFMPMLPESNFSIFNFMPDVSQTYAKYVEAQTGADFQAQISKRRFQVHT